MVALRGTFWNCGRRAYSAFPSRCGGTCTIRIIQSGFFLLPNIRGYAGVPNLRQPETQRKMIPWARGKKNWGKHGSWWYRTPIYMLNQTIWLQEVFEIITNEIATALELSQQQSQMSTVIYQYQTVEEGRACGKFNQSDCCIQKLSVPSLFWVSFIHRKFPAQTAQIPPFSR